MELVYLWVENYKNIHKQGFNFSGQYRCDYDPDKKELTIDENKDYVHIFPENINVTAIVGENGSGKSNLVDIITYGPIGAWYVLYEKITQTFFIYTNSSIQRIDYQDAFKRSIQIQLNENLPSTFPFNIFYYSNTTAWADRFLEGIFDKKRNIKELGFGYLTCNTNFYIPNMIQNPYFLGLSFTKQFPTALKKSFQIRRSEDVKLFIKFLNNVNLELPFSPPNKLMVKINDRKLMQNKFCQNNLIDTSYFDISVCFYEVLLRALIYNFLENYATQNQTLSEIAIKCFKDINNTKNIQQLYAYMLSNFENHCDYFSKRTDFLLSILGIKYTDYGDSIVCNLEDSVIFIDLYEQVTLESEAFLTYQFPYTISDGQENFLFLFARFYNELKMTTINNDSLNSIILTIDEGELTFHPSWQKKYIKFLVDFLSKNFKEYNIHLVLASHSPFLLSDLPREKVIFLKDGKQDNPDIQQTFGANIHTLLSNGFFMEDSLMGEFAKGKINEVIVLLKSKRKLSPKNLKHCEDIISIIGEPVLQKTLQSMLDEKKSSHLTKLEKLKIQRQKIEEQIKVLEEHP